MDLVDFRGLPLWANGLAFLLAAGAVWAAGTRVTQLADVIAVKSGLGHAAVGMVLLAGITSLPEAAVAVFSTLAGSPGLAVNNLLGGVAMQRTLLAAVDAFLAGGALTFVGASPVIMLQAVLGTLMLLVVAVGIALTDALGDAPLLDVGAWSWALLGLYGVAIWMVHQSRGREPWIPRQRPQRQQARTEDGKDEPLHALPAGALALRTGLAAGVILLAGFVLSRSADAIAEQSGLGASFVGAVLLALATSLPELSAVVSAMRMRLLELAISDILGTNLFNLALIFLVDAVHAGPPVLGLVGHFSLVMALLGALLTAIFLLGLIERRDRTIGRMGVDSLATLLLYLGGLYLLYQLR